VQIGAATNWTTTASGLDHSLAITTSGALYAWGSQENGQLGVGTLINNPGYWYPTSVYGFCVGPNYARYEAQANDSVTGVFAYDSTQTLCEASYVDWNYQGTTSVVWGHSSPVQVGALTTWSKIAGGFYHSVSIKTDGTLWAWGYNINGGLGLGDTADRSSPVQVGALTTWANVICGGYFTIAVKTDGTLWSWGRNAGGPLGLGDVSNRSSPVQVGTKTNWLSTGFSASPGATLAIRS
jgi:alpha-tubulin suppressor-like RCC1 family protein